MSQTNESVQYPQINEQKSNVLESRINQQSSNEYPIISIESSQEFKNIDASRSQDISDSFNTLKDSKNQVTSNNEETSEYKEQKKVQENLPAQTLPDIKDQLKPQRTELKTSKSEQQKSKQQLKQQPEVDYEGMVSLKIFQKKINESLELKNQGNQLYKTNHYQQAIQKYSQGLAVLDPQQFYGATQAECQKMAEVSASLLYNIGMCFFNINSWRQAQIYFNETIMINPNHIKALHRRALARYHLQNYQEAMNDIKQAFNKDRRNAEVHESYEKILKMYNQQLKKEKESMKEISSKIFRKESQNSALVSPDKEKKEQENPEKGQNQESEKVQQQEEQSSGLWGLAPLALVAGAALFFGYKKFFGK